MSPSAQTPNETWKGSAYAIPKRFFSPKEFIFALEYPHIENLIPNDMDVADRRVPIYDLNNPGSVTCALQDIFMTLAEAHLFFLNK